MPKSRVRRKEPFIPPPKGQPASAKISGRWVAPLMLTFFLLGLAWIVVYYIDSNVMPIQGNINLIIGFGLLGAGFITATRWK